MNTIEKIKSTGVFIPDVTVEMLKKVSIEAIEALLSEGEILDIDIEGIKESAYQRGLGQNKWIPTSERLPKRDEVVLVTTDLYDVETAWRTNDLWGDPDYWANDDIKFDDDEIVAWMPLPEPYEASEEEQESEE